MKMIKYAAIIFAGILLVNVSTFAQEKAIEKMPDPIGGIRGIAKNVVYPVEAKKAGVEGRVVIQALVDENGDVIKTSVVKSLGSGCDEAALKAIKKTKFTPGMNKGKKVKAEVTIPVSFKLNEGDKKKK